MLMLRHGLQYLYECLMSLFNSSYPNITLKSSNHAYSSYDLRLLHVCPMKNRVEEDAVRWCHLTHPFIGGGASFHSREPKTRVAEVYPYFVSKICINHSIGLIPRHEVK